MSRCAGYLAGLHSCVHPRTGLTALGAPPDFPSFAAAYDAVRGVDARELEAFEAELRRERGWRFAYGSRDVSVLDDVAAGVRGLLFNARPSLVQSSIRLDGAGRPAAPPAPPPLRGDLGTAAGGLALVAPLWRMSRRGGEPRRACVLGGGGCGVPALLRARFCGAVDVVEPADEVRAVARDFFGVGDALDVVGGCGAAFLRGAAAPGAFDVVVVDAEDGGAAPPPVFASPAFLRDLATAAPAVVGANVLGCADAYAAALAAALPATYGLYECAAPVGASQALLFAVDEARSGPVAAADVAAELAATGAALELVDGADAWLRGFRRR